MSKLYQALTSSSRSGSCSSGSEHDETASSVFLEKILDEFLVQEEMKSFGNDKEEQNDAGDAAGVEDGDGDSELERRLDELFLRQEENAELELLAADVLRSKVLAENSNLQGASLQRSVMFKLRAMGYNAAVCKSRWKASRTLPDGNYTFLDVLLDHKKRVIVDTDFRMQFEIVRPTESYAKALSRIPVVFVGTPQTLRSCILLVSSAMKKSLESQGLALPPWRRLEYLKAKWFSTYKRTSNPLGRDACNHRSGELLLVDPFSRRRKPAVTRTSGLSTLVAAAGLSCDKNSRRLVAAT